MRKLLSWLFLLVFVASFAVGIMASKAEASIPCTAGCINGQLRVCCYDASGHYGCKFVGPCRGDL